MDVTFLYIYIYIYFFFLRIGGGKEEEVWTTDLCHR